MWKIRISFFIVLTLVLGLIPQTSASQALLGGQAYLPKADLIKGSGPEVYALENGIRRWIESLESFQYFNYGWENIKIVSEAVLESYPQGENLGRYDDYPGGSLLRGSGPRIYLIELGKKRWIPTPAIFTANNFGWRYVIKVNDKVLENIKQGTDLTISEPNRYPDTVILSGPARDEVIQDSEVTFKFSGTNPLGPRTELSFETFLAGYDNYWHGGSSDEEEYRLSASNAAYTFFVRAKNKQGYVDPSPATARFSIGLSPYYGRVVINRVEPDEDTFRQDYLVLENNDRDGGLIDITGWKIESKKDDVVIPQAVKKLKYPFSVKDSSDISLPYRGKVVISFGAGSQGVNFQTNLCAGYLAQNAEFFPSLNKDCPLPKESEYSYLKDACRNFIQDLNRCELPDYGGDFSVSADSQCTDFLNDNFNYQGCYDKHNQEVDFFDGEWRVFLNKSEDVLNNDSDTIILKDRNGQIVDRYVY